MADVVKITPGLKKELLREQAAVDDETLLRNDKGGIIACEHNAYVLILGSDEYEWLHFDDFLSRPRIEDRDWTDADDLECLRWLQHQHRVARFNLGHARNAARLVGHKRRRDSLKQFVDDLPQWDNIARIERAFVDAWGAPDTPLTRAASHNFFVALIARALRPGAQVDTLWTFEGPQGSFKSRSLRALGGAFHAEISAAIGTTDFQRELRGIWIAELSELDSLRGKEASTVKRILSAPADRFVQKYALHADTYPRRAIAVASTNEATYWQDSTGARRLVPIKCGRIDLDLIDEHRLQWLAEARARFEVDATWWEFPTSIADEQEQRQQVDPWEDLLRQYMTHGKRTDSIDGQGVRQWPDGWIGSAEIMRDWLGLTPHQQGQVSGVRLGKVMRRLNYRPERCGKDRLRGWVADTSGEADGEVSA